ncbi:MAG: peptidase S41 [Burkholderiaceae bacterium]|nr:peptidase S41 [Burkholderiaceae bacterium]
MTRWFVRIASLLALAWLAGCGGGSGDSGAGTPTVAASASCSVADQRSWLRGYMDDQYFWYASQGTPDASAASMGAYFQSLLYKPTDRYSYTQPTTQFTQFFNEGTQTGYGYSLAFADAASTVLKVRYVEPASPVGQAGLLRGETVVSIDGYNGQQVAAGALPAVTTAGVPRSFTIVNAAGATRTFSVSSANYAFATVPVSNVFTVAAAGGGTAKVGYLMYQQFVAGSSGALATAFNNFRAAGVTELVVDLRYNGGGSTTVARNLASMLGGSALDGQAFAQFRYNDKHSASNFSYAFTTAGLPAAPIEGLQRVIFIASASTASASELVINGMKPFKKVVQIGTTTFGKPYAFQPRDACGTTYNAVNLESVNAAGAGGFTAGIAPDCTVADDLTHQLGDVAEGRLSAALNYVSTGACPASANVESARAVRGGATPEKAYGEIARPQMRID